MDHFISRSSSINSSQIGQFFRKSWESNFENCIACFTSSSELDNKNLSINMKSEQIRKAIWSLFNALARIQRENYVYFTILIFSLFLLFLSSHIVSWPSNIAGDQRESGISGLNFWQMSSTGLWHPFWTVGRVMQVVR